MNLLASQEGLCFMELVRYFMKKILEIVSTQIKNDYNTTKVVMAVIVLSESFFYNNQRILKNFISK
jgi:hypothetical protein